MTKVLYRGQELDEDSSDKRQLNAEMLENAREFIKQFIVRVEQELEQAKNKKLKGGALKKHKEKIQDLTI